MLLTDGSSHSSPSPDQRLFEAASLYLAMGRSVIPLYGDLDPLRAKVPTLEWQPFQRRKATQADVERWCSQGRCGGIAIVTGRISGVHVLDCDTPDEYARLCYDYPDLALTHVVQTKRGYHLYFHVPAHLYLPSRRGAGVDLLGDGRYVVAPPSVIDGFQYKVVRGGSPKTLTEADITRILAFVDNKGSDRSIEVSTVEPVSAAKVTVPVLHEMSIEDGQALYRHLASMTGRNDALFQVALRTRDAGWSRAQVENALVDLHIHQPADNQHRSEQTHQRQREAENTIRSAFSRPARPQKQTQEQGALPNAVREALLKLKLTPALRTLEALYHAGVQAGQSISEPQALKLLAGQVGRHSIRLALSAKLPDGRPMFTPTTQGLSSKNPSPRTPTPATAAADPGLRPTKKMQLVRVTKPDRNQKGRPAQHFIVPDSYELCTRLGVKPQRRDPISADDLRSKRLYRQALQREFIRRAPGQYTRQWLASRLGITVRTLQRYDTAIPVQALAQFHEQVITWTTLNKVPTDDLAPDGAFLEVNGKRYPPRQTIARRLLSRYGIVLYKRQVANYYWIGQPGRPPDISALYGREPIQAVSLQTSAQRRAAEQQRLQVEIAQKGQRLLGLVVQLPSIDKQSEPAAAQTLPLPLLSASIENKPVISRPKPKRKPAPERKPRRSKRYYHRPLPNTRSEALAQRVYETVNQLAQAAEQRLSMANARQWVDESGIEIVARALKLLQRRRNVSQPAGFLKTVLRSMVKEQARK